MQPELSDCARVLRPQFLMHGFCLAWCTNIPTKVSYIDSELLPTGEPIESHQFVHCASCSLSERASLDAVDATKWRSGSKNTRPSEG